MQQRNYKRNYTSTDAIRTKLVQEGRMTLVPFERTPSELKELSCFAREPIKITEAIGGDPAYLDNTADAIENIMADKQYAGFAYCEQTEVTPCFIYNEEMHGHLSFMDVINDHGRIKINDSKQTRAFYGDELETSMKTFVGELKAQGATVGYQKIFWLVPFSFFNPHSETPSMQTNTGSAALVSSSCRDATPSSRL